MQDEARENPSSVIVEGSVTAPSTLVVQAPDPKNGLTDQQMLFARAFVENGGKAGPAAIAAGYAHDTYGLRCLAKRKIQDEIARRVKMQTGSALAIALGGLMKVIENPASDERAVVAASLGLMDRFGLAPPKGPAVAVQVNNTSVTGPAASAVLQMIAERAAARLGQQVDG